MFIQRTLFQKLLILLAINLLHQFAAGQVIQTFIPYSEGCDIGNTVTVPIITKLEDPEDTIALAALSLKILYDPTVLTYQNYHADTLLFSTILIHNTNPGLGQLSFIIVSWYANMQPVSLYGIKKLFALNFKYNGGTSLLQFDTQIPENCEYADFNGILFPNDHFINVGKVSPH